MDLALRPGVRKGARGECLVQSQGLRQGNELLSGAGHRRNSPDAARLISSGAVCDQGYCDGFQQITCETAGSTTFVKPKQGANRLDWCLSWGQGCGAEAANAWYNAKGFAGGASSFSIAADIGGTTPTRLLSTGAVCDQDFCDGFAKITCEQ
jgi:hypothetical protein